MYFLRLINLQNVKHYGWQKAKEGIIETTSKEKTKNRAHSRAPEY
jgi:hypothetical protein